MTVSCVSWPLLFHICLLLYATRAVTQQFQLQPLNSTVLHGSDVKFQATVEGNWQVMTWNVRGFLVLTVSVSSNVTSSSPQFSARFCSSGETSCVEFIIHNVTRRESGAVICTVQGDYGSKSAQLNVQESGTVSIMGDNVTVVQDQQVEFQCVTTAWFPTPTVSWTQNGQTVDSSQYNTTSMADGDSFNSTSILKLQAVRNTTVECRASVETMNKPLSSSVFLVVVPKPTDWTVLIAIVVSFGGFALLVLLILGIIFCYKRSKEKQSNYQDEMSRRVRTQSQISGVSAAGQRQGYANVGFGLEGETSVAPRELGSNAFEMPDTVYSIPTGDGYNGASTAVDDSVFRKHRHVTIV